MNAATFYRSEQFSPRRCLFHKRYHHQMRKTYNFWVYILTNFNKKALYIGRTNDLVTRLKEHYVNRGNPKTFTGKYFCYYLLYYEWDKYVRNSIERERELKSWTREKKEALINSINPEWKFLNIDFCGKWPPDEEPRFKQS